MRATGIVRRCDDLGRVVIPKELRKTMNIKEGAPLEIYTHNGAVCFKPYALIGEADWKRAAKVLEVMLPCGFVLLDDLEKEQAYVERGAKNFDSRLEIRIPTGLVGYLLLSSEENTDTELLTKGLQVVQGLFADVG